MLNQAMEISTGVLLAAANGCDRRRNKALNGLRRHPHLRNRAVRQGVPVHPRVSTQLTAKVGAEIAGHSTRAVAGVVRAGAAAFVVGTVITAVVTIVLESLTIAEHMKIPITLRDALADSKDSEPDLGAILDGEGGPGALMTTFTSTTAIDVDPDCVVPSAV